MIFERCDANDIVQQTWYHQWLNHFMHRFLEACWKQLKQRNIFCVLLQTIPEGVRWCILFLMDAKQQSQSELSEMFLNWRDALRWYLMFWRIWWIYMCGFHMLPHSTQYTLLLSDKKASMNEIEPSCQTFHPPTCTAATVFLQSCSDSALVMLWQHRALRLVWIIQDFKITGFFCTAAPDFRNWIPSSNKGIYIVLVILR